MKREVVLIAHNIRSLWNVGSLFRTCDAFGVSTLFLTGYTALPPRREISKTALGAEENVAWEHQQDPLALIKQLKEQGFTIVSLELTDDAQNLADYVPPQKLCLVIGHEVTGVPQELLEASDEAVQIPMQGKKESLNVAVATGVALFHMTQS